MTDRRQFTLAALGLAAVPTRTAAASLSDPELAALVARAFALRDEAVRRGDQPYGAVVVKDGAIVGEGVSAVITGNDPDAHAERVALRDALQRLRATGLAGCVLIGSSRACTLCEAAAFRAGIARMYYGSAGSDGGAPRATTL